MDESRIKPRQALEAELIGKAMKDETFRKELVRNPKDVFERELGIHVPADIAIEVLEESPTTVYLVLPPAPSSVGVELADAELEHVAGGTGRGPELPQETDFTCWRWDADGAIYC